MQAIKKQFLLDPNLSYLNHGSFGACPKSVFADYQKWQLLLERNPYQFIVTDGVAHLETSKKALAAYINCNFKDVVYVPNPTMAMNIVIKNLDLKKDDEVLTTNQEYGGVGRAWKYYCKKAGSKYIQQKISLPLQSKEQFLEQFWAGLTPNTKVVFLSHITSPTGLIFPVKEVCEKAKALGLISIIDGAHVPGQIPLNIKDLDPDVYTGACHKWLLTPKGNSFLYVKKALQKQLDPLVVSWGYEAIKPSESQFQDFHQFNGTTDFSTYLTTPAALAFFEEHHWDDRMSECRKLLQQYYPIVAKELDSEIICPLSDEFLGQMCSIPIQPADPVQLKKLLYKKYNIEIPITATTEQSYLRISFQAYNGEKEIENLIDSIRKIKSTTNLL